ncbi:MAG: succinylglutamate desuccinylase/aspartoacylase family protein [Pyrinomonadaceae bacterium]
MNTQPLPANIKVREIRQAVKYVSRPADKPEISAGQHVISAFVGRASGPTLIVVGGLHGNEYAGAAALLELADEIGGLKGLLDGRVYFLAGNTRAIPKRVRFVDTDLNRHWTPHNMSIVGSPELLQTSEGVELTEIDQEFDSILITAMDEVFVLDLHSTSADGMPFATVGDTLRNREFAQRFPVTILLGIEEQLDGTMLEYLNNAGAVTLGFEGGQHDSIKTIENHKAMVRLALVNSGILKNDELAQLAASRDLLATGKYDSRIFEVRHRHAIVPDNEFEMKAGFNNFDPIKRGDVLGKDRFGPVTAPETGLLLMPLYQKLGEDGFFIGRQISPFWLWLSGVLRRIGIQKIIHILPGVSRSPGSASTLLVNTRIARILPLQIFHLLGFRRRRWEGNKLVVSRRMHDTRGPFKWKGETNGR